VSNSPPIIEMNGAKPWNVSVAEWMPTKPWPASIHLRNASLSASGMSPVVLANTTPS
jgi:hypothetical protein